MKRLIITSVLAFAILPACKEGENHTVEYFIQNASERSEMLTKCEVKDRALEDANCVNAMTAEDKISAEEKRKRFLESGNKLYGG